MKYDQEDISKKTLRFSKNEMIDLLVESFQKKSGILLNDIDKSKCRLYANGKETHHIEMVYTIEKIEGEDYNGP
jgi:hypothetical protein